MHGAPISIETADHLRASLRGKTGRQFWRSLEEIAATPQFRKILTTEFPAYASDEMTQGGMTLDRRGLLKVMAASLALAGLTGCDGSADESALPYVKAPEYIVPGKPTWYATAVRLNGYALPVLGKTDTGRPIKLEGNPDHPALQGATDAFMQASLLGLYDPDRSQAPRYAGRISSWAAYDAEVVGRLSQWDDSEGAGLRLLTGTVTSPTLLGQIQALQQHWPQARWHCFEPISDMLRSDASHLAFGRSLIQHPRFDLAEVIVSLDDDFLGPGPSQALHAHLWADRRRQQQASNGASRLFMAEPALTVTGTMAEDRLILHPARIPALLPALSRALDGDALTELSLNDREQLWLSVVIKALRTYPGHGLLTLGAQYPAALQALALSINQRIGALGALIQLTEPILGVPADAGDSFQSLIADMAAGQVKTLVILDSNPAYAAPAALEFSRHLDKVDLRIHAGLHYDETAARCHWHLPLQHDLETWSDARAVDGTVSILQPLVRPFYDVRSIHSILAGLAGPVRPEQEIVRATWQQIWGESFATRWSESLRRGFVAGSTAAFVPVPALLPLAPIAITAATTDLAVILRPDPTIWDGRFGNNAWLQELPKPLTAVTWGNVIAISPQLAADRRIASGDEVRLTQAGRSVTGPAWITPGLERNTIMLTFGYGRTRCGAVGEGLGYDAFALDDPDSRWHLAGVTLAATGNRLTVATTQAHQAMDGFDFVRTTALPARTDNNPAEVAVAPSFYPTRQPADPSWGMAIDLDTCIGCNACVVACMAENNVPVVGKELVAEGRHMHWLRVDHYYEGDPAEPKSHFQPVPCMHCEQAPCEMGCPVNATVHSFDGLNVQVYNRCIGTRTCSSYCPYKVRRFNWFDFTADAPEQIKAMRNPDVTVRQRGVMEKCTYCVQRISQARIAAKIAGREIADGEVVTACQQACPTQAITFGNIVDPQTRVSVQKASQRNYSLLEEANTRPRTTYLARIDTGDSGGGENGGGENG